MNLMTMTEHFDRILNSLSCINDADVDSKDDQLSDKESIFPVLDVSCKLNCYQTPCRCRFKCLVKFYSNFMLRNRPCIITQEITDKWRSVREWVNDDGNPNFDYLTTNFGMVDVPVADCDARYYNSQQKCTMKFKDYVQYWKQLIADNYDHKKHGNLYLKDWHFTKDFPDYNAYDIPQMFSSDWLNEFWSVRNDANDDYRFVYMGPKGSWTPLHIDVFHSYSWSANICGRKLWILFPPEEEENLKDIKGNLPFDVQSPKTTDNIKYPRYKNITRKYEVIQEPGQIIFIPSGWIHQVHNLEDTISINHNWFNGCNIQIIWKSLSTALRNVQKEIMDCKDMENWDEQCQIITRSTHGMDIKEFWTLLKTIAESKLEILGVIRLRYKGKSCGDVLHQQFDNPTEDVKISETRDRPIEEDMSWEEAHVLFELSKIQDLLEEIMNDESTRHILPLSKVLHETIRCATQSPSITDSLIR